MSCEYARGQGCDSKRMTHRLHVLRAELAVTRAALSGIVDILTTYSGHTELEERALILRSAEAALEGGE